MNNLKAKIFDNILHTYGSLSEPNFSFVEKNIERRPYKEFEKKVKAICVMEEVTDLNNEVCFSYQLVHLSEKLFHQISMVGPYCTLFRMTTSGLILIQEVTVLTRFEDDVLTLIQEEGLKLLNREQLETKIQIKLFNAEEPHICFYNALFSDTDILPF